MARGGTGGGPADSPDAGSGSRGGGSRGDSPGSQGGSLGAGLGAAFGGGGLGGTGGPVGDAGFGDTSTGGFSFDGSPGAGSDLGLSGGFMGGLAEAFAGDEGDLAGGLSLFDPIEDAVNAAFPKLNKKENALLGLLGQMLGIPGLGTIAGLPRAQERANFRAEIDPASGGLPTPGHSDLPGALGSLDAAISGFTGTRTSPDFSRTEDAGAGPEVPSPSSRSEAPSQRPVGTAPVNALGVPSPLDFASSLPILGPRLRNPQESILANISPTSILGEPV